MRRLFIILTIFLPTIAYCQGQPETPLTLAEKIFSRDGFPDLEKYITGEYKGHPNGADLPENVTTHFLLLGQDDETAVVNLTIIDSAGQAFDTYLHFIKEEDVWKVTAIRALAMTGMIAQTKVILENMTDAQIENIIELSKDDTSGMALFSSREEYEFELGNARLILFSDNELIAYFKGNEQELEKLKDDLIANGIMTSKNGLGGMENADRFRPRLDKLFLTSAEPDIFFGSSDNLNFIIGGILDNTVGYLYIKDKRNVPTMDPGGIIMIREIGNGWYLYKAT